MVEGRSKELSIFVTAGRGGGGVGGGKTINGNQQEAH